MFNLTNINLEKKQIKKQKTDVQPLQLPKDKNLSSISIKKNLSSQNVQVKQTRNFSADVSNKKNKQVTLKGEARVDTLNNILYEMKNQKMDTRNGRALVNFYERKITENFDKFYQTNDQQMVIKQIQQLEKQRFLEQEIKTKTDQAQNYKNLFNQLDYEIKKKQKSLIDIKQQINDLQVVQPTQKQFNSFQDQQDAEKNLQYNLENEIFISQSLDYIKNDRKKIVNFIQRECQDFLRKLQQIVVMYKTNKQYHDRRQDNLYNLQNKIYLFKNQINQIGFTKQIPFRDKICDELSEFEEKRAVDQIYKHGEELLKDQERDAEKQKKQLQEKQKNEKNKIFEKLRSERKIQEEKLKELQADFDMIKLVTTGNIKKVNDILDHKQFLKQSVVDLNGLSTKLQNEIAKEKDQIEYLNNELKQQKYQKNQEEQNQKIYVLEAEYLKEEKNTFLKEENQIRLQKIADESSLLVSRILYQLQSDKKNNVSVSNNSISNQLSICGLKLERMLAMIHKKKKNLKIESINHENNIERPPQYIGLNKFIAKDIMAGLQHDENQQKEEPFFIDDGVQDIADFKFEENYLKQERNQLKENAKQLHHHTKQKKQ